MTDYRRRSNERRVTFQNLTHHQGGIEANFKSNLGRLSEVDLLSDDSLSGFDDDSLSDISDLSEPVSISGGSLHRKPRPEGNGDETLPRRESIEEEGDEMDSLTYTVTSSVLPKLNRGRRSSSGGDSEETTSIVGNRPHSFSFSSAAGVEGEGVPAAALPRSASRTGLSTVDINGDDPDVSQLKSSLRTRRGLNAASLPGNGEKMPGNINDRIS